MSVKMTDDHKNESGREIAILYAKQINQQYNSQEMDTSLSKVLSFAIEYAENKIKLNQEREKHEYMKGLWKSILKSLK